MTQHHERSKEKDRARSLANISEIKRREALLNSSHIKPLESFRLSLQRGGFGDVPHFDPLDGGINASILFLFEKPGPMTSRPTGSGFISRNNDDPTAESTFYKMKEANIPRKITCTWNVIPGWNSTTLTRACELQKGLSHIEKLISLLPNLKVVALVGRKAQRAEKMIKMLGLPIIKSFHPSPKVRATNPNKWKQISKEWAKVHRHLKK